MLKTLPRFFLGYGKLLVTIVNTDSYVINSENYKNLNEQLKNGCVLVQGYGIRNPAAIHYEAFPFNYTGTWNYCNGLHESEIIIGKSCIAEPARANWTQHRAVEKLSQILNLVETCGYVTFVNTGVPDIGCEDYDTNVHIQKPKPRSSLNVKERRRSSQMSSDGSVNTEHIVSIDFITLNTKNLICKSEASN